MKTRFDRPIPVILLIQTLLLGTGLVVLAKNETSASDDQWIVHTASGPVEGSITTGFTGHDVYVFYGIPYAEPPIGQLRFKPPQPVKPWTDVFKANKKPLPCYQQEMKYSWLVMRIDSQPIKRPWSEDCLTLNIWIPKPKIQDAPVVVVFHPGTFGQGSNTYPDGSVLSSDAQTVVVSVNYRLGAFGFLYFGVQGALGNAGLLDQQLALKWINENIHSFGGKTRAVILLGPGNAGGASVGYHLLSPGSANLFTTIDSYSGSPTCPWAFQSPDESLVNARHLSDRLGCSDISPDLELECLRRAHPEDIVDATSAALQSFSLQFLPTVDGTFLKESPLAALKAGHFNKAAIISVASENEGSLPFWKANADILPDLEKGIHIDVFRKAVKRLVPTLSDATVRAVEDYYIGECGRDNPLHIRNAAIRVYSDVLIDCGRNQFESFLAEKELTIFSTVLNITKQSDPSWVKSSHAILAEFVFGYPFIDDGFGIQEKNSVHFILAWIKDGVWKKATELKSQFNVYDAKSKNYTWFDASALKHLSHYKEDECSFWNDIIPKLEHSRENCSYA